METDFEEAALAMVLNRLKDPGSRERCPERDKLDLHHFYRALGFVAWETTRTSAAVPQRSWQSLGCSGRVQPGVLASIAPVVSLTISPEWIAFGRRWRR